MTTLRVMSSMPVARDVKIVDGKLDKLMRDAVKWESRTKARSKRRSKMATTDVTPTATETQTPAAKNYDELVGKVLDTKPEIDPPALKDAGSFKLKENGYVVVARRIFNLDSLDKQTKYSVFKVDNLTSVAQFQEIPDDRMLNLVNLGLQKEALMQTKALIGGGNAKAVNDFINQFRFLPQFAKLAAEDKATAEVKSTAKKAQTKAIMDFIKGYQPLYDQLKQAAQAAQDSEEEDETSEE